MTTDPGEELEHLPQLAQRLQLLRRAEQRLRRLFDAPGPDLPGAGDDTPAPTPPGEPDG